MPLNCHSHLYESRHPFFCFFFVLKGEDPERGRGTESGHLSVTRNKEDLDAVIQPEELGGGTLGDVGALVAVQFSHGGLDFAGETAKSRKIMLVRDKDAISNLAAITHL